MTTPPVSNRPPAHEERYGALRLVATLLRILAFVVAILGGLAVVIGTITSVGQEGGLGPALLVLIGGLLYVAVIALFLFAYAEIIRLVIAVEDNTRLTAEAIAGRGGTLP
jgi:hypothetical protein